MAANVTATCNTFKLDCFRKRHDLDADQIKMSLHQPNSSLGKATTQYASSGMGEIVSANYSPGGVVLSNGTTVVDSDTACWTPTQPAIFNGITAIFDCALLYNNTLAGKNSICVVTFGQQQVTGGNFQLNMPTNAAATALVRML